MTRRQWKKISPGIWQTPTGFRVFVRVHQGQGGLKSKRFRSIAKLSTMKQWREDQRVTARHDPAPKALAGTLAEDIDERYLPQVRAMPTYTWRKRDLHAWREVFGDLPRSEIAVGMIRAQLQLWRTHGPKRIYVPKRHEWRDVPGPLSASACNHRRTALLHLYTIVDGKDAPNPVKAVAPFPEPVPEPRGRDLAFLVAAIGRMRTPSQRARARVLLWTGMRGNSELGKMKPEHVDLAAGVCHVPTGKGGRRFRTVPLNANGIAAWQEFIALKLWGAYNKNLLLRSFRRACRAEAKARKIEMPRVRMYDARHSIASAYINAGADLADVQVFLGHSTGRMTRRYAPFHPEKIAAIGRKLETEPAEKLPPVVTRKSTSARRRRTKKAS